MHMCVLGIRTGCHRFETRYFTEPRHFVIQRFTEQTFFVGREIEQGGHGTDQVNGLRAERMRKGSILALRRSYLLFSRRHELE